MSLLNLDAGRNPGSAQKTTIAVWCLIALSLLIVTTLWAQGGGGGGRRTVSIMDILLLPRVWVGAIFCLVGMALLAKSRVQSNLRLISLIVIFLAFGAFFLLPLGSFARGMGLHPSPVCSMTKPFLFVNAGRSVPIVFPTILATIAVLSLIGNKLFCGWACPVGAIQEIFHRIKISEKLKIKLPFRITNSIRTLLFIVFVPLVFSAGFSVYDYFNPFEFLHWGFHWYTITVMAVTLIAAIFIFRPFCYLVCPIGLFTWILEHLSLAKIRVNREKCTDCDVCVKKSPCPAVPAILEGKRSRPDCHVCGYCQESCPVDAFEFGR
jgi:polyferredoxin